MIIFIFIIIYVIVFFIIAFIIIFVNSLTNSSVSLYFFLLLKVNLCFKYPKIFSIIGFHFLIIIVFFLLLFFSIFFVSFTIIYKHVHQLLFLLLFLSYITDFYRLHLFFKSYFHIISEYVSCYWIYLRDSDHGGNGDERMMGEMVGMMMMMVF